MRGAGRVVTRDHLITSVWGEREITDNNLEVFIRFLREKVDLPGKKKLIHTERWHSQCREYSGPRFQV